MGFLCLSRLHIGLFLPSLVLWNLQKRLVGSRGNSALISRLACASQDSWRFC